jgi:hypothetical protein
MERLQFHFAQLDKDIHVCLNESVGLNRYLISLNKMCITWNLSNALYSDAKESCLFALLAYLCFHGLPGNVPKCTGAYERTILGTISPGKNFQRILLK